ncbi:MAG: hypothetical protein ACI8P3_003872, partial [Saprospiraceae bacterium]
DSVLKLSRTFIYFNGLFATASYKLALFATSKLPL